MATTAVFRAGTKMPVVELLLAAAGGFPLTTLAGMIVTGMAIPGLDNQFALLTYGAIVLTFMGAVHWGLAMTAPVADGGGTWGTRSQWRAYTVSMVPGLVAWVALLLPTKVGAWVLVASFGLLLVYDLWSMRAGEAPAWFMKLRVPLAVMAIGSLIVGIVL
jgi:Protein of unknown function (DUF3429)